jgi:hypothetical protein
MPDMTPEERFTRIENLLATVAENQAMQAENQARRDAEIEKHNTVIDKLNTVIDKHNTVIDKHNAAIRDLIAISRTLIDSHQRIEAEIDKLRGAQLATDEKLHILIETVDRIIRNK